MWWIFFKTSIWQNSLYVIRSSLLWMMSNCTRLLMTYTWCLSTFTIHQHFHGNLTSVAFLTHLHFLFPSGAPDFTPGFQWAPLRVALSLVFCVMFWISLFVLFLFVIVLSVLLRFMTSDYPFGIYKLFLVMLSLQLKILLRVFAGAPKPCVISLFLLILFQWFV